MRNETDFARCPVKVQNYIDSLERQRDRLKERAPDLESENISLRNRIAGLENGSRCAMSHTNLMRSSNWAGREMPEYVDVNRPGDRTPLRYVPERACRNEATDPGVIFDCSECGASFVNEPIDGWWNYCPNCGAKVEWEGE